MSLSVQRLIAAAARARTLAADTDAYRLVNAEGDGVPGITVDWFAGVAVLSLYRELGPGEEEALVEGLRALTPAPRAIYLKRRPKEARVVAGTQQDTLAPEAPLWGEPVSSLVVREQGLPFEIRPAQGLSVGLYLDAREARAWVRANAAGKTVLNCFAYTCGFGLAALAGGAQRAVNVDLSRKVLDWGEANARLQGLEPRADDHLSGDVFDWLGRFAKRGQRFDLVVLDPPSFATTRKSRFSAATDYGELVARAAGALEKGGVLLCCCNLSALSRAKLEAMVLAGLARAGRRGRVEGAFGPSSIDYPVAPGAQAALKVLPVFDAG